MTSNAIQLLPGQSAPLTTITATDQSGIVLIGTALALSFALISVLLRVFIRVDFHQTFAKDDLFVLLSMALSIVQSATVFVAVSKGFGKTVDDISASNLILAQKALYGSDILYIVTLWLTKCSVACLFIRLSPDKRDNVIANGITVATTVLTSVSIMIIALRCNLSNPWIFVKLQCPNLLARWEVAAAFDMLTELALFSACVYMIKPLQLCFEKKMLIISAFGARLPVIVPAILRLYYLDIAFKSSDTMLHGTTASICTQIQLNYAIIAATIPCLRPFMTALNTNYGAPAHPKTPPITAAGSGKSYPLQFISKNSDLSSNVDSQDQAMPATRWDGNVHNVTIERGDPRRASTESEQMIIAKRTEWVVNYDGEASMRSDASHRTSRTP